MRQCRWAYGRQVFMSDIALSRNNMMFVTQEGEGFSGQWHGEYRKSVEKKGELRKEFTLIAQRRHNDTSEYYLVFFHFPLLHVWWIIKLWKNSQQDLGSKVLFCTLNVSNVY